jgi:phage portal protein BeeE
MTIIPGQSGWPEGYKYIAAGGEVTFSDDIIPDVRPVLHMRLFHPLDDHYGFSPIEAAATAIDLHNQASKWNKALLGSKLAQLR